MHEWALAEAIISTVSEVAKKEKLVEIKEVKIKIGELQQIELDIMVFALSQLKTPHLRDAEFDFKSVQAELRCRNCENQWVFNRDELDSEMAEAIHFVPEIAHTYIKCAKCGSPDFEVIKGRGVWVESIVGVKKDD